MSKRLWVILWIRAYEVKFLQWILIRLRGRMPERLHYAIWWRQLHIIDKYFTRYKPHPILDDLFLLDK
jgi:hypothetical protein